MHLPAGSSLSSTHVGKKKNAGSMACTSKPSTGGVDRQTVGAQWLACLTKSVGSRPVSPFLTEQGDSVLRDDFNFASWCYGEHQEPNQSTKCTLREATQQLTQGRKLEAGAAAEAMQGCCLLPCCP